MTTPVTVVNGDAIIGFDTAKIDAALESQALSRQPATVIRGIHHPHEFWIIYRGASLRIGTFVQ